MLREIEGGNQPGDVAKIGKSGQEECVLENMRVRKNSS